MGAKVKLLLILKTTLHTRSHVVLMANVLFAVYTCQEQFGNFFSILILTTSIKTFQTSFVQYGDGFRKNYGFHFL